MDASSVPIKVLSENTSLKRKIVNIGMFFLHQTVLKNIEGRLQMASLDD